MWQAYGACMADVRTYLKTGGRQGVPSLKRIDAWRMAVDWRAPDGTLLTRQIMPDAEARVFATRFAEFVDQALTPTPVLTPTDPVPLGVPGSWRLALRDEFGGALDPGLWRPGWFQANGATAPRSGPINTDWENCAYDASHVSLPGDGLLHLAVSKTPTVGHNGITYPYTGGVVTSNPRDGRPSGGYTFTYGAVEARMWLDAFDSTRVANWPVLWTNGQSWPADGEIDIMEGLSRGAEWHYHYRNASGQHAQVGGAPAGNWTGWHTFAMTWDPGIIRFYYDGAEVGAVTADVVSSPHYLILGHVVSKGTGASSKAPSEALVDYVRVWKRA